MIHHFSSLGSHCMPSPNYPVLICPLPYRVAPVFVQVVSPPLGWSPLSSFLVIWSPRGVTRGPSVVFEAVDTPCPGPFYFSHSVHYIYYVACGKPVRWHYCMHECKVQSAPTTTVSCMSSLHAYSYIQQSGRSVKTMNAKNTKKSPIHENADANITCDFGDGDISRFRSRLPHTRSHTHTATLLDRL